VFVLVDPLTGHFKAFEVLCYAVLFNRKHLSKLFELHIRII
jgi:hypothetical protein